MSVADAIAYWWIGPPSLKYNLSAVANWSSWHKPFYKVNEAFNLDMQHAVTLRQVVDRLAGKVFWRPDPFMQLYDSVSPPEVMLREAGDDCDGSAMLHAQAVEFALASLGYTARIVSYFAEPFQMSHHFAAILTPHGRVAVIQPEPSKIAVETGVAQDPLWSKEFFTFQGAAQAVAETYKAKVVWYDVRDSRYRLRA